MSHLVDGQYDSPIVNENILSNQPLVHFQAHLCSFQIFSPKTKFDNQTLLLHFQIRIQQTRHTCK